MWYIRNWQCLRRNTDETTIGSSKTMEMLDVLFSKFYISSTAQPLDLLSTLLLTCLLAIFLGGFFRPFLGMSLGEDFARARDVDSVDVTG
jgi:hypothetical protein